MQLSGSDIYRAYRPSVCRLRHFLYFKGEPEAEPGPYEEVIRRLGERYEKAHLATLENVTDLSEGALEDRKKNNRSNQQRTPGFIPASLYRRTHYREY